MDGLIVTLLLAGFLAAFLPLFRPENMLVRRGMILLALLLGIRYMAWRVTGTLPAADGGPDLPLGLILLAIEMLCAFSTWLCFATMWRHADRTALIDAAERRLRAEPERLPAIDVMIPTYNEPWDVLERTLTGVLAMDYPRLTVWVLDDTRRDWLRDRCRELGVEYLTRPDNRGAKAGNLNNGLRVSAGLTDAPFLIVLDADFVPHASLAFRLLAGFDDPRIALIQTPQSFFNPNVMQHNLALSRVWTDELRFFFDTLQPAKDAWGAAFCCGTSFMVRREAVRSVGGFPEECVTEDVHLSFKLLGGGWKVRYLNERLSTGLAPESIAEHVKQRTRWAQGNVQMLFLPAGPFRNRSLTLMQRLMLIDTISFWIAVPLLSLFAFVAPVLYWYLGIAVIQADMQDYVALFGPSLVTTVALMTWISGGRQVPLLTDLPDLLSAPRIVKTLFLMLAFDRYRPFHVTSKERVAGSTSIYWPAALPALIFFGLIAAAMLGAVDAGRRGAGDSPVFVFWSAWALLQLAGILLLSVNRRRRRQAERFAVDEPAVLTTRDGRQPCRIADLSVGGALIRHAGPAAQVSAGSALSVRGIGDVPARAVAVSGGSVRLRLEPTPEQRRHLILRLYAGGHESVTHRPKVGRALWRLLHGA
jgi:cellulose synthase (UDP-forming)